jgi:hypothetical protein
MINSFSGWAYSNFRRLGLSLLLVIDTEYVIGRKNGLEIEFLDQTKLKDDIKINIENLEKNKNILFDSTDYLSIIGLNADFDKLNLESRCIIPSNISNLKEYYECGSLQENYDFVVSQSQSILRYIDFEDFQSSNWLHLHEVVNKYIRLPQKMPNLIFLKIFSDSVQRYYSTMTYLIAIGVVAYFFIFIIIFYIVSSFDNYFKVSLQLLR